MVKINNSELSKCLRYATKIHPNEKEPSEIANQVTPVVETNPRLLREALIVRSTTITNNTSGTIFNTQNGKKFMLTGAQLSYMKDATNTSTYSQIKIITFEGVTTPILRIVSQSGVASSGSESISFEVPVPVQEFSNITIENQNGGAAITASGTIYGYWDDTYNS